MSGCALTGEGRVSRWVTFSFGKAAVLTAAVIHHLFFQIESILCKDSQTIETKAVIAQKKNLYDINAYTTQAVLKLFIKYL